MTDNIGGQARTAFFNTPVPVYSPFKASFVYRDVTAVSGNADGVTFTLQNDPRGVNAIGGGGGSFGYGPAGTPITPSAALELNIYNGVASGVGTTFVTNGGTAANVATGLVSLTGGDPIQVTLTYDGSNNITEFLQDLLTTSNTYSRTIAVGNLSSIIGYSAYVGFTGATGGASANQLVANFSYSDSGGIGPGTNVLPTATALSIAASSTVDLTGGTQTVASLSGAGLVTSSYSASVAKLIVGGATSTTFNGSINDGAGQVALTVNGMATLTLTGTDTYSGGTTVSGNGTLIVTNNQAIADGTSLTVGDASFFPAAVVPAPVAASAAVAAVPEPGTLAILAVFGLGATMMYRRRRRA
jgi:hypothetical protein